MPIAESCEKIIRVRKNERLPIIREKLKKLRELKDALKQLQEYQNRVIENSDPSIFALSEKAPQVFETIRDIDLNKLLGENGKIEKLEKELERLDKRFGRDGVQIALVGTARKGKSTFLQSVSGLSDDLIPTSSGLDCTGAVSVIENDDTLKEKGQFKIQLDYYGEAEFIDCFRNTLKDIVSSAGVERLKNCKVDYVKDIRELKTQLEEVIQEAEKQNNANVLKELTPFYDEYYSHGLDYLCLLNNEREEYDNHSEIQVAELVAKYTIVDNNASIIKYYRDQNYTIEEKTNTTTIWFNKYIAVKKAYIKCKFQIEDVGKLIMMDTVGLGNKKTSVKDEAAMYKVLREDTDAAIFNYLIDETGTSSVPEDLSDPMNKIFNDLNDLSPEYWLSLNVNYKSMENKTKEEYDNYIDNTVDPCYTAIAKEFFGDNNKTPLHIDKVNNKNRDDVIEKMMIPVLKGITRNLEALDEIFMKNADAMATDIYRCYKNIYETIMNSYGKIITESQGFFDTFEILYNDLRLRSDLMSYVGKLNSQRNNVYPKIQEELKLQINKLISLVPEEEIIAEKFYKMNGNYAQTIYLNVLDEVTARILKELNDVSSKTISDIENEFKRRIARILYESGRLKELSVSTGEINDNSDPIDWLKSFCNEKLYKHPNLQKAVKDVLNFHMKIDGFIFAECIKASETLKPSLNGLLDDSESVKVKAEYIRNTILTQVEQMTLTLNESLGLTKKSSFSNTSRVSEMAKPSLLLWCVCDSFSKQFLNTNNGLDLKSFYSGYATYIWRNEFKIQDDIAKATEEVEGLMTVLAKTSNTINIKQ